MKKPQILLAEAAHLLKIVDDHESIVTDAESFTHKELSEVGDKISLIIELMFGIKERYFSNDLRRMAQEFGFSSEAAELLLMFEEEMTADVFARGDLIKAGDNWHLLELNIGSTVGGLFYASLPRLAGFPQKFDVLESWAKITAEKHDVRGTLAMIEDSANVEYMKLSLHVMASEFEKFSKNPVVILGHRELFWDGKELKGPEGPIHYISNLFNELDVVKAPEEYEPIFAAIRAKAVRLVMGPIYRLLANKGALAFLHNLAKEGKLAQPERLLVESFIPETVFLTKENASLIVNHKDDWILKPIDGFAGRGIYCGREFADLQWAQKVEEILFTQNFKSYVAQKFFEPPMGVTELTSLDGNIKDCDSRLLWGVFVYGVDYLGAFLRAKPNLGSFIINHANGASVGAIPDSCDVGRWLIK